MTRQDIQILYAYDRWANKRTLQTARALSVEEFVRDLGGSFRSVRDVLVHIIGGEWALTVRCLALKAPASVGAFPYGLMGTYLCCASGSRSLRLYLDTFVQPLSHKA
jgi:hypothetical protein